MELNNGIFNGASCEELRKNLEIVPYLQNTGYYEKLLILEFMINKLIGGVITNINDVLTGEDTEEGMFNVVMNSVNELMRKLNEINEKIISSELNNDPGAINAIREDIITSLKESAGFSDFLSRLENLNKDIDYLIEVLGKQREVMNKLGSLRNEIENLKRAIGG
jgi:flagellar hook-associated protein FlgK